MRIVEQKSPLLAALLGGLCGPFGLFYVGTAHGCVGLGALALLVVLTGKVFAPMAWVACAIWGFIGIQLQDEHLREQQLQPSAVSAAERAGEGRCARCGAVCATDLACCPQCGAPRA